MGRTSRTAAAAVLALSAPVLAACSAADPDAASGAASDVLDVVGPFELHSIDPSLSDGFFTRLQVAETLVDADGEGTLRPGLAAQWAASPDGLAWTFTLREGAAFHDGSEVDAEAVVAALRTARDKEGTPLDSVPLRQVRAVGDAGDTVRFDLDEPFAPLPAVLAHASTQVLAPSSYDADGVVTEVIGTGPYEVEQVEPPARIDVVASEEWAGDRPDVERVSYQAVGRAETRTLMAQSGQADVTLGMDPTSLERIDASADVDVASVTLPRSISLKVNSEHPVLGDPRVREALSLALDRDAMATALLRDPEMAADQLFPPSLPDWHQPGLAPLGHDPDAARALLEEAGWALGSDGTREREGEPLELTLRTFPDRPELPPLATAMQAQLAEVGVRLDVAVGNSSEIPAGHQDGTLELGLLARGLALVPDPLVTLLEDYAPEGSDWGAMGWSDDELTEILDTMATRGDGDAGAAAAADRRRVAEILQSELPTIPVAWYRQSAVVSNQVDGFTLDPLERSWRLSDLRWTS